MTETTTNSVGDLEKIDLANSSDGTESPSIEEPLKKEVSQPSNDAVEVKWTFSRIVAFTSLCVAYVGSQIILYYVGGALTYIAVDIDTKIQNWLLTANTLAVAATCPFVGYLTDLVGRRWITIFGSLLLVISSIIMGVTQSIGSSVTGMAIGGVGAGICELTALAGVAEITPVRWRGLSIAFVTATLLPFIPYLIYIEELQISSTWRWSMLIVGVWNFIGLVGLFFCYRPPPRHGLEELSRWDVAKRIDYVGALLSICGVTLFLVGLQAGGYQFPWTSAEVLAPLIIGAVLILAFAYWEYREPPYAMVPREIFQGQSVVALSYAIVFVGGMNFYSILGFFPLVLQFFYYPSPPLTIGVRSLGYALSILPGAFIGNALLSYTKGHVRQAFVGFSILMTAFGGALAACTPNNPDLAIAASTIDAFGIGALIQPCLTLALYACPDRYIGTTAALSLAVRFLGGSVGTTVYFNVFNNKIKTKLPAYIAARAAAAGFPEDQIGALIGALSLPVGGVDAALQLPGATADAVNAAVLGLRYAYADSLRYVWYVTIAFGVVCTVACAFLPNISRFMTGRVAVDYH